MIDNNVSIPTSIKLEATPNTNLNLNLNDDAMFAASAISVDSSGMDSRFESSRNTLNKETVTSRKFDPLTVDSRGERTMMGLKDMASILKTSTAFESVSLEQLERVRMMHDRFAEGAKFSFNYNTLLMVASILAGLGLVQNSSTTIIASMLVSPIMGPVVGMAYGATIRDWNLFKLSLKTECLSLVICILAGAIIGATTGWTDLADEWPTSEMVTRATWQNFFVALPIAFFSGLGVAVSLLDDQTSSLVGVAISASLLPPAVNAGILWVAYGFYETSVLEDGTDTDKDTNYNYNNNENNDNDNAVNVSPLSREIGRDEFSKGGAISLGLTLVNVMLIICSSMLMFRLKERLPIKKKVFWMDLGVARKIYENRAYLEDDNANANANDNDDDDDDNAKDGSSAGIASGSDIGNVNVMGVPEEKPSTLAQISERVEEEEAEEKEEEKINA